MIAGTGSGCGKTTVTCALLAALSQRGIRAAAFKCGPDYIDPMFHREILGTPSHNLDGFFCNTDTLCHLLDDGTKGAEIAVIEGVMGFYDGESGSAYQLSQRTETPVIAVIDCKGMQDSIGAVMLGFLRYHTPNHIAGFIFNRLPERLVPFVQELCTKLQTGYFGCLPAQKSAVESRHLGLVTAEEIPGLKAQMQSLGTQASETLCMERILSLPDLPLPAYRAPVIPHLPEAPRIAVARDRAFCFLYDENLRLLEQTGCRLVPFSPLHGAQMPDADGLYLCGGYPELYAAELSANSTMLRSIRDAIGNGMPTIAECGGFLYLHTDLQTKEGICYPMADVIAGSAFPTERLQRFGYITMTAKQDSMLCEAGRQIRAHEFHYWDSTACGSSFHAEKPDGRSWNCCHTSAHLYAGFPHLYFYNDTRMAVRFAQAAAHYGEQHGTHPTDHTSRPPRV